MTGAPPTGSGSRASHEAASSTASSPKASIPNAAIPQFGPESSPPLPWSDAQVAALNRQQDNRRFHPFTCGSGNRSDDAHVRVRKALGLSDNGTLIATRAGWFCPACDYRQDWAHAMMFWGADAPSGWLTADDLRGVASIMLGEFGEPTAFAKEHGLCPETVLVFMRGARDPSRALAAAMGYERRTFYRHSASGMSASGRDRETGHEAKPASAVAATSGETPQGNTPQSGTAQ